jgi:SAM-dependent methyltransferase
MSYKEAWDNYYRAGYTSGAGSYGALANFKAQMINEFIADHGIQTVLDIGCGDGNQLSLLNCPEYIGVDVSPTIIELCKKKIQFRSYQTF